MSSSKSLTEWLSYLEAMHPVEIDMGLDRIRQIEDRLEINKIAGQVITVAGTNGKGTSCAFIEAYAKQLNKTVGLYTSPHLIRFNERIRINHQEVSDAQLVEAFEAIERVRTDNSLGVISLTYFEFTTLAAMWLFKQARLDVAILEVGLGGRLDAVNIIDPDLALVTSIGIDHEAWLGSDIQQIGREKAGIFRSDIPAVFGASDGPESVAVYASEIGADFYQAGIDYSYTLIRDDLSSENESGQSLWRWQAKNSRLTNEGDFSALIQPGFPIQNVATCIAGLLALGWPLNASSLNQAIEGAYIRGRMESFEYDGVAGWLDVAHNPDAAGYLATQLAKPLAQGSKLVAILGAMADKDIDGVVDQLSHAFDAWLCIGLPLDRAIKSDSLAQKLLDKGLKAKSFDDFSSAFEHIKQTPELQEHNLVVLGSFFTVAEAVLYYER